MKQQISVKKEVELTHIEIYVPVRYDDEDIPYDFPLRVNDYWKATVEIDTGIILEWPKGETGELYMKVCDEGCYYLFDDKGKKIASIEGNYVPHGIVPGEYGDYISLKIDKRGIILNWPENPNVDEFFDTDCG